MLMQSETFHHISAMFISSSSLENCCIESSPTPGDDTVIGCSLTMHLEIGYVLRIRFGTRLRVSYVILELDCFDVVQTQLLTGYMEMTTMHM